MLPITIEWEEWDETKNEFVQHNEGTYRLEHSLISISKWESLTHKPFFNGDPSKEKTEADVQLYIQCMAMDKEPPLSAISHMTKSQFDKIIEYINDKHTATWFRDTRPEGAPLRPQRKTLTSEVIYWEMIQFNIPFECQKWHVERLLTLIRVCQEKQQKPSKIPGKAQLSQQAKLNAARKAKLGTTG